MITEGLVGVRGGLVGGGQRGDRGRGRGALLYL